MTTTTINFNAKLENVTLAQVDACHRCYDADGHAYYLVESESDATKEYKVAALNIEGKYFLTCDCLAGSNGINCKHKIWTMAATRLHRFGIKPASWEVGDNSGFADRTHDLVIAGEVADDETYNRVVNAPARKTSKSVKRTTDFKPFSIMR